MKILWAFFSMILVACASTPQTDAILADRGDLPPRHENFVPFLAQDSHYCGPASLAMAMAWAGHFTGQAELGSQSFTPQPGGAYQNDLIGAARRQGMIALPLNGMQSLLTEIAAGNSVVVLQNLALSWYPIWHYAVAIGYDLGTKEIILHSGGTPGKRWDLDDFEETWQLADHWGLLILRPGEISATHDATAHAAAASWLEENGRREEAEQSYRAILAKWPDSLLALIGLANTRYAAKDFRGAIRELKTAVEKHPDSSIAKQNLEEAKLRAAE